MIVARPNRPPSDWRWFPAALLGSLAVVFAVNAFMVYTAVTTFPGQAGQDGFDLSNAYGRVLDLSARQAALGWQVTVETGSGRRVLVRATDRSGLPLLGAVIEARAERPVGPKQDTRLALQADGPGRLLSDQALAPGRWTVFTTIGLAEDTLSMTTQLILP